MTAEQVAALGPAFTEYLGCFRSCFLSWRSINMMDGTAEL